MLQIKAKITVTLNAGSHISVAWYSQLSLLVHDVHESIYYLSGFCKGYFHVFLVIEIWITLVGIKSFFIISCYFPDCNRNNRTILFLNGELGTCLAAFVEKFIVFDYAFADNFCAGASEFHLLNIEV